MPSELKAPLLSVNIIFLTSGAYSAIRMGRTVLVRSVYLICLPCLCRSNRRPRCPRVVLVRADCRVRQIKRRVTPICCRLRKFSYVGSVSFVKTVVTIIITSFLTSANLVREEAVFCLDFKRSRVTDVNVRWPR